MKKGLLALLLLLLCMGCAQAKVNDYESYFDKNKVMQIDFQVDEALWQEMLNNASSKQVICCNVSVNGEMYYSVGVNCKGNSSLMSVNNDRYSLKITFDDYVKQQSYHGLDKFVLNNMQGDATYMKEYLSYDMFAALGVKAPLYAFANVTVNGQSYGFMLAVEVLEADYMLRSYGVKDGQLYKVETMDMGGMGGGIDNMMGNLNLPEAGVADFAMPESFTLPENFDFANFMGGDGQDQVRNFGEAMGGMLGGSGNGADLGYTDDDIASYSAIFNGAEFTYTDADAQRLIAALKRFNSGDIESSVDAEAILRYFAVNTVLVNTDHYVSSMLHNYYLYEYNGILTMLPWDYNLAFGGFMGGDASSVVNFPIDTPVTGTTLEARPMLGILLGNETYLDNYHTYLQELMDIYFADNAFAKKVDELDALIGDYVRADANPFYTYEEYQASLPVLKLLGEQRAQSVQGQLDGTVPSTTEAQAANPSALIESSLNLQTLGSQGGGMGGGMGGFNMDTFDRTQGTDGSDGNSFGGQNFPGGNSPGVTAATATTEPQATATAQVQPTATDAAQSFGGQMPQGGDMPQMPEGFDPSQLPQGQMPEGFDASQMPQGFDPSTMMSAGASATPEEESTAAPLAATSTPAPSTLPNDAGQNNNRNNQRFNITSPATTAVPVVVDQTPERNLLIILAGCLLIGIVGVALFKRK